MQTLGEQKEYQVWIGSLEKALKPKRSQGQVHMQFCSSAKRFNREGNVKRC